MWLFFSSLTFSDELTTLLDDEVMITSGADHLVIPWTSPIGIELCFTSPYSECCKSFFGLFYSFYSYKLIRNPLTVQTNLKTQEARENPNNPQEIRSSLESNLIPKLGYSYNKTLSNKNTKIPHNNLSRSEVFDTSSKTKNSNTHTLKPCDFPNS